MATPTVYRSSQARDWIWATAVTQAAGKATQAPLPTVLGQGWKPHLCSDPSFCSWILNPLCHWQELQHLFLSTLFFSFGCTHSIQKLSRQGLDPYHSSDRSNSSDNARSSTRWAIRELQVFNIVLNEAYPDCLIWNDNTRVLFLILLCISLLYLLFLLFNFLFYCIYCLSLVPSCTLTISSTRMGNYFIQQWIFFFFFCLLSF